MIYCIAGLVYHPKYKAQNTEAVISWDVAGYYLYLPAIFIHQDIKKLDFTEADREKYKFAPTTDSYYTASNGNKVLKYSIGMAVLYTPAFAVGHLVAGILGYDQDGYTLPYQLALMLQGFLVIFIGLLYLRRFLLLYFSDTIVAITLILIALGTNLLTYGSITNAMSHNYLFTAYSIILWYTYKLSLRNQWNYFIIISIVIGLMALARPTEILAIFVPLGYIISSKKRQTFDFIKLNKYKLLSAALIVFCIGFIQLFYWKFVSGQWIQYSYQDQGFSWLRPHIWKGFFSFKAGWIMYTPLMALPFLGFFNWPESYRTWKIPILLFISLFIYVTFAWDIWWYGGSLGQRALIQIYPILAIPFAHLLKSARKSWIKYPLIGLILVSLYINLWWTHQAHHGGWFRAGEMTKHYYKAIIGRTNIDRDVLKLLDSDYIHTSPIEDSILIKHIPIDTCLSEHVQNTTSTQVYLPKEIHLIRAYVDFEIVDQEWQSWRWAQLIFRFYNAETHEEDSQIMRLQRINNNRGKHRDYLDAERPSNMTHVEVYLWNASSKRKICINEVKIYSIK